MQPGTIETKDLWQGAYVLSEGGTLEDVRVEHKRNGKKEVIFVLSGSKVEWLLRSFESGQAACNISQLRANFIHLKDVVFRRIDK